MTQYQHIIWDWNGTLLDDVELAINVMNRLLNDNNLQPLGLKRYREIFDFPVQLYYESAGFDLAQVDFPSLSDQFCAEFEAGLTNCELFVDTQKVLTALADKNHFVLSNTQQDALLRMLAQFDIKQQFAGIYGLQDNMARGKVTVGQQLIKDNNLDPTRAVMIGDTTHDADVAQQLGCDCILVNQGHNSQSRLLATNKKVIGDLDELLYMLKS